MLLIALCVALLTYWGGIALAKPICTDRVPECGDDGLMGAGAAADTEKHKKRLLWLFTALLLGCLCFFKYANIWTRFLADPVTILLPLGISFYTFEALSYLIDIYHGKLQPEKNLLTWLTAILFFPQFSSGPIARMRTLLPQIHERRVTLPLVSEGLRRILMGAMAKIAVADGLAILVNAFYGDMTAHTGLSILLAVFLYPLQIYFDFMGYSSMAVGSALLFGVRLQENFTAPFFATTLSETWKRWHISLTGWFQDYIFTPLVWSRWWDKLVHPSDWQKRRPHMLANLTIVFFLSGIWHGSTFNYAFWGLLMALGRIAEETVPLLKKKRKTPLAMALGRIGVFLWWTLTLVFFRLTAFGDVLQLCRSIARPTSLSSFVPDLLNTAASDIAYSGTYFLIYFGSLLAAGLLQLWFDSKLHRSLRQGAPCTDPLADLCPALRWALYWLIGFITAAMYLITQTSASPSFIYAGY
ncbi:MAG: MBOAT family protein [Oscillospiraceae bacterium]|nr:MBOAT family protein [Oscillospiraceae bacterium]